MPRHPEQEQCRDARGLHAFLDDKLAQIGKHPMPENSCHLLRDPRLFSLRQDIATHCYQSLTIPELDRAIHETNTLLEPSFQRRLRLMGNGFTVRFAQTLGINQSEPRPRMSPSEAKKHRMALEILLKCLEEADSAKRSYFAW